MGVSGTGLSGSATFTANDSDNVTFTVTSNATNANTASTIVARDASGNFAAGDITAADLFPAADNTGVVGDASLTWSNGQFTSLTIDSTLNVRGAVDLADNDILRFGSGDDAEFFCNGSHFYLDLNSGIGNFYIRDGTTTRFTFDDNGTFTATSNITAYSDERLKKDWAEMPENFIECLASVKSGTYTRTDLDKRQAGSSAQDWAEFLPEVVTVEEDENQTLSLAYGNAAVVSAVELAKAVVKLKKELADLKAHLGIGDK